MNTSQISHVEFEGGPEDGLILDAGLFRKLETIGDLGSPGLIPMLVREEVDAEGSPGEAALLGHYMIAATKGSALIYNWHPLS